MNITNEENLWTFFTNDLPDKDILFKLVELGVKSLNQKDRLALTIFDKPTNTIIGSTSIGNISERDKRVEIGWTWLCRKFHGKGTNDQTKYLLLKYCFDELGCERVEFKPMF